MSSPTAVPCREIFDENSQPSAEEISEYAQQLGIDPESESHLLPLARDGLMQALPPPWKAYFDEKLQTHYYYNEETKKTQWDHPLDNVYRELVKKARDASIQDDTCASVQELLTSEEYTKHLERVETKVDSDDEDLFTDSEHHASENNNPIPINKNIRLTPLGRPPPGRLNKLERRLTDLKINPKIDYSKLALKSSFEKELLNRQSPLERPKMLFKQQSEIIDLKIHVLDSPEDENYNPLLSSAKIERGLPLQGKGSQFFRVSKSDLPSPDTDKSLPLDSVTKSDPPKGILREKRSDSLLRRGEGLFGRGGRHCASLDEDRKSVRFQLESLPDPNISPGSNSSSEQNEQNSIASAPPPVVPSSPVLPLSPLVPNVPPMNLNTVILSPLVHRPPLPPRILDSPREKSVSSDRDSNESVSQSPRRRVVRPPPADYIKPDLFQKSFHKIADLVRPDAAPPAAALLPEPAADKEARPRSPMIPQQKNKISINLMESIESETSIDSPDKEFANLDLNDLDISNENNEKKESNSSESEEIKESPKTEENSEKSTNSKTSMSTQNKSPITNIADTVITPQIKVPKLDLSPKQKSLHSDSDNSKQIEDIRTSKSESIEIKAPQLKVSPTPSLGSELRSPRYDFNKPWSSPLSTFKPLNKAVIAPLKSSDSALSLGKSLTSPRLDGVILSQGKSSTDNVVVVYQFENTNHDENYPKPIKSPLMPDVAARDMLERNKQDERRRLELSLQKELENIRVEWCAKERRMRAELEEELKEVEEKFITEKKIRLEEQAARNKLEIENALEASERVHEQALEDMKVSMEERRRRDQLALEKQHEDLITKLQEHYQSKLDERRNQLEIENERALSELRSQLTESLCVERTRLSEENKKTIHALREEHASRIAELRTDYRAEVERIRTQHACHLEELRARLASERGASRHERALADKYRGLKEKYARLKHDVKMSIERRNKRREMSMTTGSETEKSNSHKANNQSLERCKEANETSVSATEPNPRQPANNNCKLNDNETSHSDSHTSKPHNNNGDWRTNKHNMPPTGAKGAVQRPRRAAVGFTDLPPAAHADPDGAVTTDCQDSSDATTADEKPKEPINGHGRRRYFTRLKSASTSRLNYSPKRGRSELDGWTSPLECLRQQLRKLDDLEEQFPDLACHPNYSLRYPFAEIGRLAAGDAAGAPELEFVRHRALVEREGMRRARAVLRTRRAALRGRAGGHSPQEEREVTELEVALHRARALLGEKEIRLRHIERALRSLTDDHYSPAPVLLATPPPATSATHIQDVTTSEASSGSSAGEGQGEGGGGGGGGATSGAVLRSLRALHADVRDIWRALDARPIASPDTSSANAPSTSHTRMTLSAPEAMIQDDGSVASRARGLRAWLQAAP